MLNNGQQSTIKEQVSTYLYFSSLYFISVGVLYLWGYWFRFDVNILEYLSLADILKSAAYPVASTFIFFVIGVIHGYFSPIQVALPEGGGQNTRIRRVLTRHFPHLVKLYILVIVVLYIFGPTQKWVVLPVLFALPMVALLRRLGLFESLIPDSNSRMVFLLLLAALPPLAYGKGRMDSAFILDGKAYKYVTSQIEGVPVTESSDPTQRLRFLGHAGDFLFLLNPDKNTLIITKFDQAKSLQIKKYIAPYQTPFPWLNFNTEVKKNATKTDIRPAVSHPVL